MTALLEVGLGYRRGLHPHYLTPEAKAAIDFVELAPENYLHLGGPWRRRMEGVRREYPTITHGLALSLGGEAPLDSALIDGVAAFAAEVGTPWHSDHLCWSSAEGTHLHELLPLPLTRAVAKRTAARIRDVASALPVPLLVENVSAYGRHPEDELSEGAFVGEIVERAGCRVLLDVNNVFVNSINFGGDPLEALLQFPLEAVAQIHVAGFDRRAPDLVIDTHAQAIDRGVYPLLAAALERTGPVPILLERDDNFPPFEVLLAEIAELRRVRRAVLGAPREAAGG